MPRLFIALPLPGGLAAGLRATVPPDAGLRATPADQVHLTLRFIGQVSADQAMAIESALGTLRFEPFPLQVVGAGRFGMPGKPRGGGVLWAGLAAQPALTALHRDIEAALQVAGVPAEGRAFHPHVTVARMGPRTTRDAVDRWMARNRDLLLPAWQVECFVLFESRLHPGGAEHVGRRIYPAAGARAGGVQADLRATGSSPPKSG